MDADGADLPGVVETDELPRLAAVGRLVDAASRGDVAAHAVRAGTEIDNPGIGVGDGDRPGRSQRHLAVGDRQPVRAAVRGPEHSAAGDAHVERARLRRHTRHRRHAPAPRGPDEAVLHPPEERRIDARHHREGRRPRRCARRRRRLGTRRLCGDQRESRSGGDHSGENQGRAGSNHPHILCEVRGARYEVRGARCEAGGGRCEAGGGRREGWPQMNTDKLRTNPCLSVLSVAVHSTRA
jgi:hypothetical protein